MKTTPPYLFWYYLGTFFLLSLFIAVVIFFTINQEQEPLPYYNSQVDTSILNDVVALSISPLDDDNIQTSSEQFTLDNFKKQLATNPSCEHEVKEDLRPSNWLTDKLISMNVVPKGCDVDCQLQKLIERLKNLDQAVYNASTKAVNQGKINNKMHLGLPEFINNTCEIIGTSKMVKDSQGSSAVTIKPFHILSAIKQFDASSKNLMERGNIYWCEAYRDKDKIGEVMPERANSCHVEYRQVQFADKALAVRNPWSGLSGCIAFSADSLTHHQYLLSNKRGRSNLHTELDKHCETLFVGDDKQNQPTHTSTTSPQLAQRTNNPATINKNNHAISPLALGERPATDLQNMAWGIPDDFSLMMRAVNPLRRAGELLEVDKDGDVTDVLENNTVEINGFDYPIGLHVQSTIVPEVQAMAQQVAECYTGNLEVCHALKIKTKDPKLTFDMTAYYENAPARRVGIAIMDVKTGNIEALASSYTECYEHDHAVGGAKDGCPTINYKPRISQDQLTNFAFYGEAQPASTVKPIMTLSFLPYYDSKQHASLKKDLITSDSENYTQRLFCEMAYEKPLEECPFAKDIVNIATSMGANQECQMTASDNPWLLDASLGCGMADLTLGNLRYVDLGEQNRGKVPQTPTLYYRYGVEQNENANYGVALTQDFNLRKRMVKGKPQYRNKQADLNSTIGLGQGSSRVSPVGVAGIYAHIVNSAKGRKTQTVPHLVDNFIDVKGKTPEIITKQQIFKQQIPVTIPEKNAKTLLKMMSSNPHQGGTGFYGCQYNFSAPICNNMSQVAGKTGTPTYKRKESQRPLKWYASAYKSDPAINSYDKTMAVLIERNWKKGHKNISGERNNSAFIAFSVIKANNDRLNAFKAIQATNKSTTQPKVQPTKQP